MGTARRYNWDRSFHPNRQLIDFQRSSQALASAGMQKQDTEEGKEDFEQVKKDTKEVKETVEKKAKEEVNIVEACHAVPKVEEAEATPGAAS